MPFTLKDYSDIREIAKGGMSRIYCATQISLNRKVVIKEMAAGLVTTRTEIKRFENEAQAGASLSHDNIIRIYDFGEENNSFYIAMEYIDGSDLDGLMQQEDFPREIGLMILLQALRGLAYAHEKGVVHRDVKAANILVGINGAVKVSDFGIAYAGGLSSQLTSTAALVGTPAYMPPERVNGEEARHQCVDIWAAGVMLYRLVTGVFPFTGENVPSTLINIVQKRETPADEINKTLPPALAGQLRACLEKDRAKRLPVLAPLVAALQDYIFDLGVRNPLDTIQGYFSNKSDTTKELRAILARYHAAKAREFQDAGKYATALAHYQETVRCDPGNAEIARAAKAVEKLVAVALTTRTASVQQYLVTQVRRRLKSGTRKRNIAVSATVVAVLLASGLGVVRFRHSPWMQELYRLPPAREAGRAALHGLRRLEAYLSGSPASQHAARPDAASAQKETKAAGPLQPSVAGGSPRKAAAPDSAQQAEWFLSPSDSAPSRKEGPVARGLVRVDAAPPLATVIIDGRDTMTQEQRKNGITLANGKHRIAALASGFATTTASITVAGNDTQTATLVLAPMEKKIGALQIFSNIAAEVYIDGEFKGNVPIASPIALTEGQHAVVFKRLGYKPYQKIVAIRSGETREIKLESGGGNEWE